LGIQVGAAPLDPALMGVTEGPNVSPVSTPTAQPPELPYPEEPTYPLPNGGDAISHSEMNAVRQPEGPGFLQTFELSAENDWSLAWASRQLGMMSPDHGTPVTENDLKETMKTLPEEYWDWLPEAQTKEHLQAIAQSAKDYDEREKLLAMTGATGAVQRLLVNVLDPTFIGASLLTEGAAAPVLGAMKLGRMGRLLASAAVAGTGNVLGEAVSSTVDPTVTGKSYLEAFGYGAVLGGTLGVLRRNPVLHEEANATVKLGQKFIADADKAGSVGAASTGGLLEGTAPIIEGDVPHAFGPRLDSAGWTTQTRSKLAALLAPVMGEVAGGFKGHEVVPIAATEVGARLNHQFRSKFYAVVGPAWKEFADDPANGVSFREKWGLGKKYREFSSQVGDYVQDPNPGAADAYHPAVVKAGNRFRQLKAEWLDRLWNPGLDEGKQLEPVQGFENVLKDPHYFPKISDGAKIDELVRRYGVQKLQRFVRNAILPEITDADMRARIADGWLERIHSAGYGIRDPLSDALRSGKPESIKEALLEIEGLKPEDIDNIVARLAAKDDTAGSSRSMRRSPLDYTHSETYGDGTTLSMKDFFLRDADEVFNRYSREMSGRVALAKIHVRNPDTGETIVNGIRGEADFNKYKEWIRQEYLRHPGGKKEMGAVIQNLDYLHGAILGRPIYKSNAFLRRVRDANFVRLMSRLGLNELQEFGMIVSRVGVKAMMTQMPTFRHIVEGGIEKKYANRLAQELSEWGVADEPFIGEARWRHLEEISGEQVSSTRLERVGQKVDNALVFGKNVTQELSFFRFVHSRLAQWASKSVAQTWADMAHGRRLNILGGKDVERMAAAGIDEKMAERVHAEIRQHAELDGKKLVAMNFAKWNPEVRSQYLGSLFRVSRQLVLNTDPGNAHRWMSHPMGKLLSQFRVFLASAWVKRTLDAGNHLDMRAAATILMEIMMGAATHAVNVVGNAAAQKDPAEYRRQQLSVTRLATAGIGRSGIASFLPAVVDSGLAFTGRPGFKADGSFGYVRAPLFDARSSATPNDLLFGVPAVNFLSDSSTFTGDAIRAAITHDSMSRKGVNAGLRSLPWGNWWPITSLVGNLTRDLPYSPPRTD
jgi:hypothetical protein